MVLLFAYLPSSVCFLVLIIFSAEISTLTSMPSVIHCSLGHGSLISLLNLPHLMSDSLSTLSDVIYLCILYYVQYVDVSITVFSKASRYSGA